MSCWWVSVPGEVDQSPRTQVLLGTGATAINGIVVAEADGSIWKRLEGNINEAVGAQRPVLAFLTTNAPQGLTANASAGVDRARMPKCYLP
eukprot:COSAG01_NODE_379_length_17872_cov_8.030102_11_plen_91_part_00